MAGHRKRKRNRGQLIPYPSVLQFELMFPAS